MVTKPNRGHPHHDKPVDIKRVKSTFRGTIWRWWRTSPSCRSWGGLGDLETARLAESLTGTTACQTRRGRASTGGVLATRLRRQAQPWQPGQGTLAAGEALRIASAPTGGTTGVNHHPKGIGRQVEPTRRQPMSRRLRNTRRRRRQRGSPL
jgi:hypothetical protein